jgi:hypothetical protein
MKTRTWDNEERRRYYGVRVGDTVRLSFMPGYKHGEEPLAEVVEYGFLDNNRVYVKREGSDEVIDWVAEWCDVVVKVEDKNGK